MGDKKFTLLELHLDGDTQFGPKTVGEAVLGSDEAADEALASDEDRSVDAADDGSRGVGAIGVLVGLAALVAVALAARKFRGGDDDDEEAVEEFDEPDVIVD